MSPVVDTGFPRRALIPELGGENLLFGKIFGTKMKEI